MDTTSDPASARITAAPILFACPLRKAGAADGLVSVFPSPALTRGFREGQVYRFSALSDQVDELLIDDEPLTPEVSGGWGWSPGFYAGVVRGLARSVGRVVAEFLLDVSPHPEKLGRDAFKALVDDLWDFDPGLVLGAEPAGTDMGTRGRRVGDYVALERVRRYGASFLRALAGVAERPRRRLVLVREHVSAHRLRRVDVATAHAALRGRDALAALRGEPTLGTPTFDVPAARETLDSAPNRALAALVCDMRARIARLVRRGDRLLEQPAETSATRTSQLTRWPERRRFLADLDARLARAQRQSPLREVTRAEITAAGLTSIQSDPLYARAWSMGWRALREGIADDPEERHALSPTWELSSRASSQRHPPAPPRCCSTRSFRAARTAEHVVRGLSACAESRTSLSRASLATR